MTLLKEYIYNIAIAVILVSAVEMLLPDNQFKKYCKFVLGLIIMVVILNPVLKLFDKNFNIDSYTKKATAYFDDGNYEKDYGTVQAANIDNTLKTAADNINTVLAKSLNDKFGGTYKVLSEVVYDEKNSKIDIKDINVTIQKGGVNEIKKIRIKVGEEEVPTNNISSTKEGDSLKEFISKELGIKKEIVNIYKE